MLTRIRRLFGCCCSPKSREWTDQEIDALAENLAIRLKQHWNAKSRANDPIVAHVQAHDIPPEGIDVVHELTKPICPSA